MPYIKHTLTFLFVMLIAGTAAAALTDLITQKSVAPIPEAVSNNAVTSVVVGDQQYILSFSGLGKGKKAPNVHNRTYIFNVQDNTWKRGKDVPIQAPVISIDDSGEEHRLFGRLASVATSIGKHAYVFGGYTVGYDHTEVSIPDVYKYAVDTDTFTQMSPMPVPVDDSIALTYQSRYIYLFSGWHNDGNVNLVQVFDTQRDTWQQASPFPGRPVFGHAGGIVDDTIVICDGVSVKYYANKRRSFTAEPACFIGKISTDNPNKIDWRTLAHPTGKARYRMAAYGDVERQQLMFVGGSDNPYNYNGIGYNGEPSTADGSVWIYDIHKNTWSVKAGNLETMDHRGLIKLSQKDKNNFATIGGMNSQQEVLNTVNIHFEQSK
ncbi:Kelch repeat-containing protein [Agaribacter marinus]|uniref:Kelch repeat-containing protein n=1 Tax=Agaribacter marinus TaxID=1431249 RepID=UPI0024E13A39|nr:kelch repeat-containing protein [Agaribacter marinus]